MWGYVAFRIALALEAVRLIEPGTTGLMVAIENSCTTKPADISMQGERRVDVERMYDPEAFRPHTSDLMGIPLYLG